MRVGAASSAKFQEATSLVMTNTGTATCTLSGYLKLRLVGPGGPLPTTLTLVGGPARTITLNPGHAASSLLVWYKYDGQGNTCSPTPTSISVTPPHQTAVKTIPWIRGLSGSVCGGKIEVHPIVGGSVGS